MEIERVREKREAELKIQKAETERINKHAPDEKCPECHNNIINDYERAERVCSHCGLVVEEDIIDRGPDWRAFDQDQKDKRAHTGPPLTETIHDKGLTTTIGWINNKSSPENRAQLYRMRKWQRRIRVSNATERNLAFALSESERMSSALGLPRSIRETTAVIYRKAVQKNLIRGRSIEGVAASALYAACRQSGVPRTLDEVAEVSRVSRKEIGRTYRFISRELDLKLMPTSPIDYIPRFCSALHLHGDVQNKALEILRQATEKELTSGRGPTGVAAASIYIASVLCSEHRTQREIANVAGVTEVTIRNRYRELTEKLGIEIII